MLQPLLCPQPSQDCQEVPSYLLRDLYQNRGRYLCVHLACPMDKIPFEYNKFGLESFHINRTIVKMLKINLQPPATV